MATDQIRNLLNKVTLSGKLAELKEVRRGNTQKGIPYISIKGAIQFSPNDPVYTTNFSFFAQSVNAKGEPNKNYELANKFAQTAQPMTKNPENPTLVSFTGAIEPMNYVGADESFHESFVYNMSRISDFEDYKGQIDIEGFILSINPETKGEEEKPTGRAKMRLFSRTYSGNVVDLKNIFIPNELVPLCKTHKYVQGATAVFFIDLMKNSAEPSATVGGIGTQRTTSGKNWVEMVMTGAQPVIKGDKALSLEVVKAAMNEWAAHNEEIKAEGYKGNKNSSTNSGVGLGVGRNSGEVNNVPTFGVVDIPDEDFPF